MRARVTRGAGLVTAAVALAMLWPAPLAVAGTQTFTTPGPAQFQVPADVCSLTITVNGAQGGFVRARLGGPGGQVRATLAVTPGEILGVFVGGAGQTPAETGPPPQAGGAGGTGGGGPGGAGYAFEPGLNAAPGAGGGGASDVRQAAGGSGCVPCAMPVPPATPGSTLAERVIVAGGGGGAGMGPSSDVVYGGAGGGTSGGTPDGDGAAVSAAPGAPQGGQAGASGGAGGTGGLNPGHAGSANQGGAGADTESGNIGAAGGGGGGGVFGGGGGASGDDNYAASAGGGSSFVAAELTNVTATPGGAPASTSRSTAPFNGSVTIDYTPVDTCPAVATAAIVPRFTG